MPLEGKAKGRFLKWYGRRAKKFGIGSDPYNPKHHYDYEAAYGSRGKYGRIPDKTGHWPSKFKKSTHPRRFLEIKGKTVDTTKE